MLHLCTLLAGVALGLLLSRAAPRPRPSAALAPDQPGENASVYRQGRFWVVYYRAGFNVCHDDQPYPRMVARFHDRLSAVLECDRQAALEDAP